MNAGTPGGGVTTEGELRSVLSDDAVLEWLVVGVRPEECRGFALEEWHRPLEGRAGDVVATIRDASGRAIGGVRVERAEISFFVGSAHWGRGHASRAVRRVADGWRQAGHGAIAAQVDRGNRASIRVLEKAGFAFAGFAPDTPRGRCHLRYVLR